MGAHFSIFSIISSAVKNINWSPFTYFDEEIDITEMFHKIKMSYKKIIILSLDH